MGIKEVIRVYITTVHEFIVNKGQTGFEEVVVFRSPVAVESKKFAILKFTEDEAID